MQLTTVPRCQTLTRATGMVMVLGMPVTTVPRKTTRTRWATSYVCLRLSGAQQTRWILPRAT